MLETRQCAADGCTKACPKSHLMCVPHWRKVPAELKREVYNAHRVYKRARSAVRAWSAAKDLREAQAAAIGAVREKELKKANPDQESFLPPP